MEKIKTSSQKSVDLTAIFRTSGIPKPYKEHNVVLWVLKGSWKTNEMFCFYVSQQKHSVLSAFQLLTNSFLISEGICSSLWIVSVLLCAPGFVCVELPGWSSIPVVWWSLLVFNWIIVIYPQCFLVNVRMFTQNQVELRWQKDLWEENFNSCKYLQVCGFNRRFEHLDLRQYQDKTVINFPVVVHSSAVLFLGRCWISWWVA